MQRVCRKLQRRGVRIKEMQALELFGADGDHHLKDYARLVSSLEIWEIDPAWEHTLRQRFPTAKLRIVDSYQQIKKTSDRYDLIVADPDAEAFHDGHCEHFDLFPDIFRIAKPSVVVILNVVPELDEQLRSRWSFIFNKDDVEAHLARRQTFYQTTRPDRIGFGELVATYKDLAAASRFELEWHFFQKRHYAYYLVLKLTSTRR